MTDDTPEPSLRCSTHYEDTEEDDYLWRPTNDRRDRSLSYSHSRSHPTSRRASPSRDHKESYPIEGSKEPIPHNDQYTQVLGYSAEFLAGMLCPQRAMCHQKFELVVDDLAFIGHPVCSESDCVWRFKQEKVKMIPRGRGSKKGQTPQMEEKSLTPEKPAPETPSKEPKPSGTAPENPWLQTFHLVLVLDLPDPSSSASGKITKYLDTIYEQIAFTVTAVLFHEQVKHNFVETECDALGSLESDYISKGEPFGEFMSKALDVSSIALAMKTIYTSIKQRTPARVTIHDFPLELQLPPYLSLLLHSSSHTTNSNANPTSYDSDSDYESSDSSSDEFEHGEVQAWSEDMQFAWRLPALTPWKSLLRLDDNEQMYELHMKLRGPQLAARDRELAEQLIRFLDQASITLSLADMASLLDWDLKLHVYPTVRWLVHHRRAKLVDMVHPTLKTVFSVPARLPAPIKELSEEFAHTFNHPSIPPLPKLLSLISSPSSLSPSNSNSNSNSELPHLHQASTSNSTNHFYAAVVRTEELIPLYHEVLIWLLKKDLVVRLHLRVRVVVTPELKARVREERARKVREKEKRKEDSRETETKEVKETIQGEGPKEESTNAPAPQSSPVNYWLTMSPKSARRHTRKLSLSRRTSSEKPLTEDHSLLDYPEESQYGYENDEEEEEEEDEASIFSDDSGSPEWDRSSIICDPARATRLERAWLAAMSEGKELYITKRFEQINQYFNGKCTDDEILYKADITRKQLREVLHHYDLYLETFLHPS